MIRHRFDPFSAVAGLLSLASAVAIGARTGPLGVSELQLIGPVAILLLGLALVLSAPRRPADAPPSETGGTAEGADAVAAEGVTDGRERRGG